MKVVATGPSQLPTNAQHGEQLLNQAFQQNTSRQPMTNREKMVAVFSYINEHLDGNEQAIFELGEEYRAYGQQFFQNKAKVQNQLYNNEQNIGKIYGDAKEVFNELRAQI